MAGDQAVVIKKVKKGGDHGHHGGAWKVAYADFVTAMMAFFLLLWLLSSVTQEQLEGISDYFAPTDETEAQFSGSGGLLGGKTVTEEGAATDSITMDLPPPKAGAGSAAALISENEDEQFEEAKQQIEDALQSLPHLKKLAESLMIENTPEGLKIQLIDQDGLALFPSGSAKMYLHTRRLIEVVSKVIMSLPQQISISGHTDAVPFLASGGYSNWSFRPTAPTRLAVNCCISRFRHRGTPGSSERRLPSLCYPTTRRIPVTAVCRSFSCAGPMPTLRPTSGKKKSFYLALTLSRNGSSSSRALHPRLGNKRFCGA